MAAPTVFPAYYDDLAAGVHNLYADEFAVLLVETRPPITAKGLSDVDELPPGNGYQTWGLTPERHITAGPAPGVTFDDVIFTAAGGPVGPIRGAVMYNRTESGRYPVVAFWDLGRDVTLKPGETLTVVFDRKEPLLAVGPG